MVEPLLIGGTAVDDEVMSLVRLSEFDDAQSAQDVAEISELISVSLNAALERERGNDHD